MMRLQLEEAGHYLHKEGGNLIALPSVSTILTPDRKLQALNTYRLKKACLSYLNGYQGISANLNEEFWVGMPETIDKITSGCKILWNKRPYFQPKWESMLSEHSLESDVLSLYDQGLKTGFSSTCDLIYLNSDGKFCLVEFVASKNVLSINLPPKEMKQEDPEKAKILVTGVISLKMIRIKLAARTMAVEQSLGIKIDTSQVVVSTEDAKSQIQIFSFNRKDSESDVFAWSCLLDKYIRSNPLFIVPEN